jgi:hypothetical protein
MHRWFWIFFQVFSKCRKPNGDRRSNQPPIKERTTTEMGQTSSGAFSVNVIREKMSPPELEQHDCAWGLNFGDPKNVIIAPLADHSRNRLPEILNEKSGYIEGDDIPEHPMSINMAENYEQMQSLVQPIVLDSWMVELI